MRTFLYDWHVAHGARMVDFAGWDMPIQYGTIIDEHHAVRRNAGLFDISHMGRLWLEGPGALDLIQYIFTNDAATMKIGQVRYGLVCNEKGGILDDVLVYRFRDAWLIVVNASNREKILRWIEQHQGKCDCRLRDLTFERGMIALQGPRAEAVTTALLQQREWGGNSCMPGQLKYYHAMVCGETAEGRFDSEGMIVSRTGYTGEDGFEIIAKSERLTALCNDALGAAQRLGIDLKPCGLGARDTLRLEAGMPLYGHELSEQVSPFQAGLAWAVKLDKPTLLGRAALAQVFQNKSLPRRIGLELDGKRIAREGTAVLSASNKVGQVTSGTFSPTLEKAIAMAWLVPECAEVGTRLEVDIRGRPAPARVVPLPFYKRM